MEKKRSVGLYIIAFSILISHAVALIIFFNHAMFESYPKILVYGVFTLFPFINTCLNYNWYTVGILYSLVSIILSIFIFLLKNMARIIFVVFQILILMIGIAATIFVLFWLPEMRHQGMSIATFIFNQLLKNIWMFCFFPLLFLIYFTLPRVKEQFKQ